MNNYCIQIELRSGVRCIVTSVNYFVRPFDISVISTSTYRLKGQVTLSVGKVPVINSAYQKIKFPKSDLSL